MWCAVRRQPPAAALLFRFDTAVIAGTTRALTAGYGLSAAMLGLTVSSALWDTVLGSVAAGPQGDRFERRTRRRVPGILHVLSAFECAFARHWSVLLLFRSEDPR
jgi:SP family arabinose:H+ symporter-like MFS transporter